MTRGFTSDQLTARALSDQTAKAAINIELSASEHLRYCTGAGVTISGTVYQSRGMRFSDITFGDPRNASVRVEIDNVDKALSLASYNYMLTGKQVTMHLLLRAEEGAPWTEVLTIPWSCDQAAGGLKTVTLQLSGGVGLSPKAGLTRGGRLCPNVFGDGITCLYSGATYTACGHTWADCQDRGQTARFRGLRWAPVPGQTIRLGSGFVVPGGDGFSHTIRRSEIREDQVVDFEKASVILSSVGGLTGESSGPDFGVGP